jgi:hypothetical protein
LRAHEASFALAELDCFTGEREDPDVPVAVEEPLEGPGGLVHDAIARAQHGLTVVLADATDPVGDDRDLEVGVVRVTDLPWGAADVLPG